MNRRKHALRYKVTAWMLTAFLITGLIPDLGYAAQTEPAKEPAKSISTDGLSGLSEEDVISVTENTTTFDAGGDKETVVIHGGNVRFENEKGRLVEYDPSLKALKDGERSMKGERLEGYSYTNCAGDMKHYLPEGVSEDTPVLMEKGEKTIRFSMTDSSIRALGLDKAAVDVEKDEVQTVYDDYAQLPVNAVYDHGKIASLTYTSAAEGVKETLILEEMPESNVFTYRLELEGMTARENITDEGITYYDEETGDIAGFMEAPWMDDAGGDSYSEDVTLDLEETGDGEYLITMTLDEDYLSDPERQYPVTVDPTNTWQGDSEVKDAYVISGSTYSGTNFYESGTKKMPVGVNSTGTHRTYIKFLNLKAITKGHTVTSAKFTVYEAGTGAANQKIAAYRILKDWNYTTLTWKNKPTNASSAIATVTTKRTAGTARTFDLTSFAQDVAVNGVSNFGIVLRNITSGPSCASFYGSRASSYKPKLVVTHYTGPTPLVKLPLSRKINDEEFINTLYFLKGERIYASWMGITSPTLADVEYKVTEYGTEADPPVSIGSEGIDLTQYRSLGVCASDGSNVPVPYTEDLPEGRYRLYIRGVDEAGNCGEGRYKPFYIDDTEPEIEGAATTPQSSEDMYSAVATPEVSWDVSDKYFSHVTVSVDGGDEVQATTSAGAGSYTVPEGVILTAGKHEITVTAYDLSGNSSSVTLDYYADIAGPEILSLTSSPATLAGEPSSVQDPVISWQIEDDVSEIKLFVNGEETGGDLLTAASESFTLDEDVLSETGEYEVVLEAHDEHGNVSREELMYYLDIETPVISGLEIAPETGLLSPSGNRSPEVSWIISDRNCGEVLFSMDGENFTALGEGPVGSSMLPSDIWTEGAGTYTVYVKVCDRAGNESAVRELTYHLAEGGSFIPQDITAGTYYGKNLISWDLEAYDAAEAEYDIHRSTEEGFTPSEDTLIAEDIDAASGSYTDPELLEEGTYYYMIAVRDINGADDKSGTSAAAEAEVLFSEDDIKNTSGSKDYLSYTSVELPTGTAMIEESSGNLMYDQTDFAVSNAQLDYSLARTYGSGHEMTGMLGKGWMDSYHREIYRSGDDLYLLDTDGSFLSFEKTESGTYSCEEEPGAEVTETDGEVTVTMADQVSYRFDSAGRLAETTEPNGCSIKNIYDGKGRLSAVISSTDATVDKIIRMEYDGDSMQLSRVSDLCGTVYTYTYEGDSLEEVTVRGADSAAGEVAYRYGYGESSGKLEAVYDGEGNLYSFSYSGGKTAGALYPDGEKLLFSYGEGNTVITKKAPSGLTVFTESTAFDPASGKILSHTDPKGSVTSYTYSEDLPYHAAAISTVKGYESLEDGKVTFHETEVITETSYEYDQEGNITKETSSDGTVTDYDYDDDNNVTDETTVTDGETVSDITYGYDEYGNLTWMEDEVTGEESEYEYNGDGSEISSVDKEGETVISESTSRYNEDGDLARMTTASGSQKTTVDAEYDAMGREIRSIENGIETLTVYDFLGRAVRVTVREEGKDDIVKVSVYDKNGSLISETETGSAGKYHVYDSRNRNISEKTYGQDIPDRIMTTEYGFAENVKINDGITERTEPVTYTQTVRDTDGDLVSRTYIDVSGSTVKEESGGSFTDYTYDKSGNQVVTYMGSPGGGSQVSVSLYDLKGNETGRITAPEVSDGKYAAGTGSQTAFFSYDEKGNVIRETDGEGNVTGFTYDDQGRITSCTIGDSGEKDLTVSYRTLPGGDTLITATDANGNKSTETVNEAGLTVQTKDLATASGAEICTDYMYDSKGRLIKESRSDGSYIEYSYEGESDRISSEKAYISKDVLEREVVYSYDGLGRMTEASCRDSDGDTYCRTEYAFDAEGKLKSQAVTYEGEGKKTTGYSYDEEGRITEKEYPVDSGLGTVTYGYDAFGRCISVSTEDGKVRDTVYDGLGRVSSNRSYDEPGSTSFIETEYMYDSAGRAVSAVSKEDGDDEKIIESFTYGFDGNGNITSVRHMNDLPEDGKKIDETRGYTFDDHGRLILTEKTDHLDEDAQSTVTYSYDKAGNRTSMTEGEETVTYTYNGLDQLTSMTEGDAVTLYTYDARGNLILEENEAEGTRSQMSYSVTGEMKSLDKYSGESISLTQENVYDHEGIRISSTEAGTKRSYYYDQGSVSFTMDGGDLSGANILSGTGAVIGTFRGNDYHVYLKDMQGSTTNIVKDDGTLSAAYEYSDFGETTELTGNGFDNEICYTGGIYDEGTELYYLNARYYDPELGRFISQDSYRGELDDPAQWHLYAYCANDPINYVDPSGHWSETYTRNQARNTYILLKAIYITNKVISYVTASGFVTKIAKSISKKAWKTVKSEILDEIEKSTMTTVYTSPLKYLHSKLQSGFRRGGYDYLRSTKTQKSRKNGTRRVTVTEPIIRIKLVIRGLGNIKFYYSSNSRKNVIM